MGKDLYATHDEGCINRRAGAHNRSVEVEESKKESGAPVKFHRVMKPPPCLTVTGSIDTGNRLQDSESRFVSDWWGKVPEF